MEKVLKRAVLCFLREKNNKVLLAKKLDKIGRGSLNGYGGGIEGDEPPSRAALREIAEECGVIGYEDSLRLIALVDAHNETADGQQSTCRIHVFDLSDWNGDPQASHEMGTPQWHNINKLPFDKMMLGDRYWVSRALLAAEPLHVEIWYGPGQKTLRRPQPRISLLAGADA